MPFQKSQHPEKPTPKDEIVLACGCGCRTWYLHCEPPDPPTAKCAECGRPPDPNLNQPQWLQHLPTPPDDPPCAPIANKIVQFNEPYQAINHLLNQMNRRWKSLCANITFYDNGHISVYCRDVLIPNHPKTDPAERQWYIDRLEDARRMLFQEEETK